MTKSHPTEAPYKLSEFPLTGKTGISLYAELYKPLSQQPIGTVVLVHGLGEYSGRYEHVCRYLTAKGYQVLVYDHQGHGRSAGTRGHVESFRNYADDLEIVVEEAQKDAAPIFLLAHSMGSLVALDFLGHTSMPHRIRAAVFIGIPLKPQVEASRLTQWLGIGLSRFMPKASFKNEVDPRFLARNEAVGEAYAADPLINRTVTAGWFVTFLKAIERVTQDLKKIDVPALFLHGGEDKIAHPAGSRVAYQVYPAARKHLHIYEGCYHELLNEEGNTGIMDEIVEWYQATMTPATAEVVDSTPRNVSRSV